MQGISDDGDATLAGSTGTPPTSTELRRGDAIGRYVVLGLLGAGGMGVVYAAYDPELDRKVAVKLLHPTDAERGRTEGRRRLLREAQALARLTHPNVVAVHDAGEHVDRVFLAMEFVDGDTLRAWLDGAPRTTSEVLATFRAAGHGLAAAHASGLVHGDFKPHNVLVARDGRVVVMDFGLARSIDAAAATSPVEETMARPRDDALRGDLSATGGLIGTPAYMAPEQFGGTPADARSDQFSFAIALWEGLAGERPFTGDSALALAAAVTAGRLREPTHRGSVPAWIRRILQRALAVDPALRFADMNALLHELARDPGRTRRRLLTAAAAVVIAGSVASWMLIADRRARAACAEAGASIAEVWGPDALARVRDGLGAAADGNAAETLDRVSRRLDDWTAQWSEAREHTCLARLDGTRTARTDELAVDCLEEQRVELDELVALLGEADRTTATNAAASVATLAPLSSCRDETALARRVRAPDDPGASSRVSDLRRALTRAKHLRQLGRGREARPRVEELLGEAEALGWPPLAAEVGVELAKLRSHAGDYDGAEVATKAAFFAALQAAHDEAAADAAAYAALITGLEHERRGEGLVWVRIAETLLSRMGESDGYRASGLLRIRGQIAENAGDVEAARDDYERALEIRTRVLGEDHPMATILLGDLGHLHREQGSLSLALSYFEKELASRQSVLGLEHPDVADVLMDIGATHEDLGDYDQAISHHRRALEIAERAEGPDHPGMVPPLNGLGTVHDEIGRYDDALAFFERALAITERVHGSDHPDVALILNNMAFTYMNAGRQSDGLAAARRGLDIRERTLGREHPQTADSLRMIGELLLSGGSFRDAADTLERALAMHVAVYGERSLEAATSRFDLGRALVELGRHDDGIREIRESLAVHEERLGRQHHDVAEILAVLGRAELAAAAREAQ